MQFNTSQSYLNPVHLDSDRYGHVDPAPYSRVSYPTTYLNDSSLPIDFWEKGVPDQGYSNPIDHLNAITQDIEPGNGMDPLDRFFHGKRSFLAKSVEEILGLIYEREHLKYENIRKIEYDSCRVGTRLFQTYDWPIGSNPNIDRIRSNLEKELFTFEREKRMEDVSCWRDVCRLKSEFREVMREVSQEKLRQDLITR